MIWRELGISGGTALIVLCALYFVIKWAVRKLSLIHISEPTRR